MKPQLILDINTHNLTSMSVNYHNFLKLCFNMEFGKKKPIGWSRKSSDATEKKNMTYFWVINVSSLRSEKIQRTNKRAIKVVYQSPHTKHIL